MNAETRTVLMILYYFPPAASGGTYRPLKFVRYLPEFGWRSIVIAPFDNPFEAEDPSLLSEIPHGTEIFRVVNGIESSWHYRFFRKIGLGSGYEGGKSIDRHSEYVKYAIEAGLKIISKYKIDVIFTSVPPYSLHIAGRDLSQARNIPWVADFRDPWISCPFYIYSPERMAKHQTASNELDIEQKYREIEKSYFETASAVISFPEPRAVLERGRYPSFAHKIISIDNGYDPMDFPDMFTSPIGDDFRITHVGSITRDRTVSIFIAALSKVIRMDNKFKKEVKLQFIGAAREPTPSDVYQYELQDITTFRGYLPHNEACAEMVSSDLLFMVLPNLERAGEIMPLRLFEYIYSGRPIFLIGPRGSTSEFFERANAGVWVEHMEVSAIAEKLYVFIERIRSGEYIHKPNLDVLKGFDRRSLTEKLAKLFDRIVSGGPVRE